MAKRLKAPIDYIINRILNGRWDKNCEWSQENFRTSVQQHPCDANIEIVKAMDGDDDDYLMFTIEHLIHIRFGNISQCFTMISLNKVGVETGKINWRE